MIQLHERNCSPSKERTISQIILFICLFVVIRPTREFFIHMESSPLPVKGSKSDLYSTSLPSSSEDSQANHSYCDTGHPCIMVISTHFYTCCRTFNIFLRIRSVAQFSLKTISYLYGQDCQKYIAGVITSANQVSQTRN